ncbi:hypothetical protein E1B28_002514 [Marasmius oreades]|uniref:F-box domain-containing protein n=1 Tax=Marasmius oreades TaxID=181124 RepID=A0A9P7UKT4_9AGAR|nr:uncharacterized protein E1B28_002514 [Marasmius oreades]KAG7086567.1 hypothetical protein E1B28_002514 [Marasmius oreades]
MQPALPHELLSLILGELPEPNLLQCALVCRAWNPISRSLVFRTISLYSGKPVAVKRFLRLCDSPYETFSTANIQVLSISHYLSKRSEKPEHLPLNRLLTWHSSDGKRTIPTMFHRLRRLTLFWVDWSMLVEEAKRTLSAGFKGVTDLELYSSTFAQYDEFSALLHSFPVLRSMEMTECRGPSPESECTFTEMPSGSGGHASLEYLSICRMRDAKLIQLLVPSPSLRSFIWWHLSFLESDRDKESFRVLSMVNQVLLSASSTLEELGIYFGCYYQASIGRSVFEYLDLSRYTRLRSIGLSASPECIMYFLNRLASIGHPEHDHSPLKVLKIPSLPSLDLCWYMLDNVLQSSYFSSLCELQCDFPCSFSPEDVTEQAKALWYDAPDKRSTAEIDLQERMEHFRMYLPRCNKRGILKLRVEYWYVPRWLDDVDFLPRLTRRQRVVAAVRRAVMFVKRLGRRE